MFRVVSVCDSVSVGVENPCPLFENGVAFRCDRDASATLNFCLAGYGGLVRKSWPTHLLRGLTGHLNLKPNNTRCIQ